MQSVVWTSVEPSEQLSVAAGVMEESGGDVVEEPALERAEGEGVCWGNATATRAEERIANKNRESILLYLISPNYCDYGIQDVSMF